MAARVFSQQLDRTKPLWELWLVEGLRKKRFALISKTHHALVDGVSGVDIATVLFDVKPVPEPVEPTRRLDPQPEPSGASLAARGVEGLAKAPFRRGQRVASAVGSPGIDGAARSRTPPRALGEVAWEFANPAPDLPLNTPIGPHRRYVWVRGDLAEFKRIKSALGGTVNDVVLCRRRRRRCGAGCAPAASAPRGSSCARWSRSRSAARTSTASSATRSPPSAVRCPSTSRTRSSGCGRSARRWTGSRARRRRSAPR